MSERPQPLIGLLLRLANQRWSTEMAKLRARQARRPRPHRGTCASDPVRAARGRHRPSARHKGQRAQAEHGPKRRAASRGRPGRAPSRSQRPARVARRTHRGRARDPTDIAQGRRNCRARLGRPARRGPTGGAPGGADRIGRVRRRDLGAIESACIAPQRQTAPGKVPGTAPTHLDPIRLPGNPSGNPAPDTGVSQSQLRANWGSAEFRQFRRDDDVRPPSNPLVAGSNPARARHLMTCGNANSALRRLPFGDWVWDWMRLGSSPWQGGRGSEDISKSGPTGSYECGCTPAETRSLTVSDT